MQYRFLRFPGNRFKAVTLSYDDGRRDDLRLSEMIEKYGMKATFNINSGLIAPTTEGPYLTKAEIRQLLKGGHEIAVHGDLHRANGLVSPLDGIRDVLDCRLKLEREFDCLVRGMAYPDSGVGRFADGVDYNKVKSYLTDLGIVYARTTRGDEDFMLPADWHAWAPTAHHAHPQLSELVDRFLNIREKECYCSSLYPRLFYLWGHSFEFGRADNWELLETFCQAMAGHEDIWFATNMEIYAYVNAYRSLVFSADGSMVYNPTLMPVWFCADGKSCCVNVGETLRFDENGRC